MTLAHHNMLTRAMDGLARKRDVSLYVVDKWYKVKGLTNDPDDDGAAYAELITGVQLIFPLSSIGAVLVD